MFIELHMIQNFSPSNLNRDDTNNPKDCEFGGYRRARISSQSLKRAIRYEPVFAQTTEAAVGERSKWMSRPIKEELVAVGKDEEQAASVSAAFIKDFYAKSDKKNPQKSSVLLYFSQEEVDNAVEGLLEDWEAAVNAAEKDKSLPDLIKALEKETKNRTSAPDIALFGRMLAEKPELNIDAACQVAHAISTHRINMEMDFYTAVDDLQNSEQEEGAGAGMMGFTNFNSACFYRYARIDWQQLVNNLGGDVAVAARTVKGFLRAEIDAIPSGKQNSFAAQNPTSLAIAVVRQDGKSWNMANAFEEPVHAGRNGGLIGSSILAFDQYWQDLTERRDDAQFEAIATWVDSMPHEEKLSALAPYRTTRISDWIAAVNDALPKE